jgi:guanylate kinase
MGKTPLIRALYRFYPRHSERLQHLVLYNSRDPRPNEISGVEHHFSTREEIERMRDDERFVVIDVRGDLQALDVASLCAHLKTSDCLYEGNPYVASYLLAPERLANVSRLGIFLSPLSRHEIEFLCAQSDVSLPALITELMRGKLIRRAKRHSPDLSDRQLQDIRQRAGRAYQEMKMAHLFDYVVANHDGEDSDHWETLKYPLGDARKTLLTVAALLEGQTPENAERWATGLLP